MDTAKKLFGEKVFFFRKKRQYKQETLRDLSGVSQAEISRIERGRYQEIKVETIISLAQAFEVDPDELVRGTELPLFLETVLLLPTSRHILELRIRSTLQVL